MDFFPPSCVCLPQSPFSVRNRAGMAAYAWASTRVAAPKDSRGAFVKLASLYACTNYIYTPSYRSKTLVVVVLCLCSGDHPLCAPLPTRGHLQSTQHLYVSQGHCRPTLSETVSVSSLFFFSANYFISTLYNYLNVHLCLFLFLGSLLLDIKV